MYHDLKFERYGQCHDQKLTREQYFRCVTDDDNNHLFIEREEMFRSIVSSFVLFSAHFVELLHDRGYR